MAGTAALPLQQLIASLDNTCMPKILQVCSGVYFQGKPFIILLFIVNLKCESFSSVLLYSSYYFLFQGLYMKLLEVKYAFLLGI